MNSITKDKTPQMFDEIAKSYDKLNHILSFGLDKLWRKKFVKYLRGKNYKAIADIASGTGDLLINLQTLNAENYYIIDPSSEMLAIAKTKINKNNNVKEIIACAENISLPNNSVDLACIAFGIRNFSDLATSLSEVYRILDKDGIVSIMEFSVPKFILLRWSFLFYLKLLLPIIGRSISKNKHAYSYLKQSIIDFSKNVNVSTTLTSKGFNKISEKNLNMGIVKIYTYRKSSVS
jgi:demethylmenaquinone methyltransferase/2-methoxy-6-polyprenyl-1,4-benzoquinol methylase